MMLLLRACNLRVLLRKCGSSRRQFTTSLHVHQSVVSSKRKWNADDIQTLVDWKKITADIFGPLVNEKSGKSIKNRSSTGKISQQDETKVKKLKKKTVKRLPLNDKQLAVNETSISNYDSSSHLKLVQTRSAIHNVEDKSMFEDSFLELTNYSETQQMSATEHEMPESFTTSRTVSKQPVALESRKFQSRSLVPVPTVQRKYFPPTSDETFDYQWVNQSPEVNSKHDIALSFERQQSQDVCFKSTDEAVVAQKMSKESVKNRCEKKSQKLVDNFTSCHSEIGQVSADFNSKNIPVENRRRSNQLLNSQAENETFIDKTTNGVSLVSVETGLNNLDSEENQILSYPLIITNSNKTTIMFNKSSDRRVPSVTKILQATQSPESRLVLQKWEKQMIAELGEVGFAQYKADMFANGSNLHTNIELLLTGRSNDINIRIGNEGHWHSIEPLLSDVSGVQHVEHPVRHCELKYAGIADCIAEYRGVPSIIEWKTSQRRKANIGSTFDNPLQLVAYLGAYNYQMSSSIQVEQCVLVIGYSDGNAADVHVMKLKDCLHYWSAWLSRLNQYYIKMPE